MKIRVNRKRVKIGSKYKYDPRHYPELEEYTYVVTEVNTLHHGRFDNHNWTRNDNKTGYDNTITLEENILQGKAMFI